MWFIKYNYFLCTQHALEHLYFNLNNSLWWIHNQQRKLKMIFYKITYMIHASFHCIILFIKPSILESYYLYPCIYRCSYKAKVGQHIWERHQIHKWQHKMNLFVYIKHNDFLTYFYFVISLLFRPNSELFETTQTPDREWKYIFVWLINLL